ncbi:hypothetical protein KF840_23965 [bacterium]|nr:hypothetical protein [bacterium]
MLTKRMLTMTVAAVAVTASAAMAGTKYQSNVVNASTTHPPGNPTVASGKVSVQDNGNIKVGVKGVTDGGGAPVDSSTSYKDTATLDGSEYIYIVKLNYTALGVDVEIPVVLTMKKGGGKGAVSLGGLTSNIPMGVGRSLEVTGGELWGPLGAGNVPACTADVTAGFAILSSACKGGTRVGVAGIAVP